MKEEKDLKYLLDNYIIFNVVPDFEHKVVYTFLKQIRAHNILIYKFNLYDIIKSATVNNLPGKFLNDKKIFDNIIFCNHGIEWVDADGFALHIEQLRNNGKIIYKST